MKWYTPVIITVMSFVVHLIITIGSALEDPFGDDVTDLPMEKFCYAIEVQVEAIFHDKSSVEPGSDSLMIGGGWLREKEVQSNPFDSSWTSLNNLMGGGSTKDLRFSNGFVQQKSSTQIESQRKIIVSQRNIGGLYQQSQMNIVIEGDDLDGKKKEELEFES